MVASRTHSIRLPVNTDVSIRLPLQVVSHYSKNYQHATGYIRQGVSKTEATLYNLILEHALTCPYCSPHYHRASTVWRPTRLRAGPPSSKVPALMPLTHRPARHKSQRLESVRLSPSPLAAAPSTSSRVMLTTTSLSDQTFALLVTTRSTPHQTTPTTTCSCTFRLSSRFA